jgi:hypothetical protein
VNAAALLDRLDRVRSTGPGRWIARCPAHEDRGPSLSIRELDDGRILLNDFGGCGTDDVLAALGLQMSDLFPKRPPEHSYRASSSRVPARDLLEVISAEVGVVDMIAADLLAKKVITEADWQRFSQAAAHIHRARDHLHD